MAQKYREYGQLDLPKAAADIAEFWQKNEVFEKSISTREGNDPFVFYEGPPSANGLPGIHHVLARGIKDLFCRYKTLKGFKVSRKAGWDTHGLPVELGVEKELGITKEDIGSKISVEEYNDACRKAVMRYTDVWRDLTEKMGYWVDMDDPYVTYETKYIESVWHLLKKLFDKNLIYKGYTIQPYSPAAGTGLSSHELNMPGTYRDVKDTTVVAQFKVQQDVKSAPLFEGAFGEVFFLAWTTTPWTLPSNTALTVGAKIEYVQVRTYNMYTHEPITVIIARELAGKYFPEKNAELQLDDYSVGDKAIPFEYGNTWKGSELAGMGYEQLMPYAQPEGGDAFKVITGDFVTTEDGTGMVHTAPSFGADDQMVAKQHGIGSLTLVDLQGRFNPEMGEFAGRYVKNEYYPEGEAPERSVDVDIAIKLKEENRAFKVEKYEHSYPHCWRTDKPILYYPLDSWFIKTTEAKDRLIALNKEINWKPESTGTGRFGNWLENLQDWNLSRSRFWGIPIPIWSTEDGEEHLCIGSLEQLKAECAKSISAGLMDNDPLAGFKPGNMDEANYNAIDIHKPNVDPIVLVSEDGKPMHRQPDLIDVWFDSGSMPYAQWHYPFENKEVFEKNFPADMIAEGVDQTRGWFFTLHAIGTMCFDSVAYKNVVSNGLVLDKDGQKMSKRLGNAADPFDVLGQYGPDATRWYMISNAQPWDNLKFDADGITEVQRKFFRALYNSYSFFALYANIDGFHHSEADIPLNERPEIDRWIISKLNSLVQEVDGHYADYEPTRAARAVQEFVVDHLSNWYVRLCRRRFWKGEYAADKIAAYQTLYRCLEVVAQLASPIAPFYMDRLFQDLNEVSGKDEALSVHLSAFPEVDSSAIDEDLEQRMGIAQKVSSMVLSLRKKETIKVRQPLQKIMVPVLNDTFERQLHDVEDLILSEVNVKELEYLTASSDVLSKRIKPNFKTLGPKYGKLMKAIASAVNAFTKEDIAAIEGSGSKDVEIDGQTISITLEDVEIGTDDIPGWSVATEGGLTVALDINISPELEKEGLARELVSKVQTLRKESGYDVMDRIDLRIKRSGDELFDSAMQEHAEHISREILGTATRENILVESFDEDHNKVHTIAVKDGLSALVVMPRAATAKA